MIRRESEKFCVSRWFSRANSYLCAVLARLLSTKMKNHSCKCLVIRYGNKSPIFFALYWRPGSCVIRCLREGILLCVYCFSVDFMDHISYHFLHFSDFEAFFGWEQIRLSILFRVLIRKFGIYSQVNLCNIWKKQKVFQLPSLFVSLCYYISAAVDERANILV